MPVSEKNCKEILMTCGQDLRAAQNTVLNRGMRDLHNEVGAWVGDQWTLAQDAVINRLVSDKAPNFTDVLDPRLIEWSNRVLADLRSDMQARLLEDLDHEILQPWAADKVAVLKLEAEATCAATVADFKATRLADYRENADHEAYEESRRHYTARLEYLRTKAIAVKTCRKTSRPANQPRALRPSCAFPELGRAPASVLAPAAAVLEPVPVLVFTTVA